MIEVINGAHMMKYCIYTVVILDLVGYMMAENTTTVQEGQHNI